MNPRRWILGLGLFLTLTVTSMFALRVVHHVSRLHGGDDEPIRPWMNVPYIAHAYGVPPDVLFEAVQLPPDARDRRPLMQIAREQQRPIGTLIADVMGAIAAHRGPAQPPRPAPPPLPPPPPTDSTEVPIGVEGAP